VRETRAVSAIDALMSDLWPYAPRVILERALERLAERNLVLKVGVEAEYSLLARGGDGSITVADDRDIDPLPCYEQTSPSLGTLTRLANAAGVPFTALFRGLDEEHDAVIVPAGGGLEISHEGDGRGRHTRISGRCGVPVGPSNRCWSPSPNPMRSSRSSSTAVWNSFTCSTGYWSTGTGRSATQRTGDTMQFRGDVAHGPIALIELPVRFLSLKVHEGSGS